VGRQGESCYNRKLIKKKRGQLMIDFEIPEETKLVRNIVREFVHEECIPAEKGLTVDTYDEILAGLRQKARG
jgi:acyl-CoA dehydrogenase